MTVQVLLFARARDVAGTGHLEVNLPDDPRVGDLRRALADVAPALTPLLPRLHIAVNSDYAHDEDPLPPGAEVACFPPVSGG
jgi:sulfur-carrier protein